MCTKNGYPQKVSNGRTGESMPKLGGVDKKREFFAAAFGGHLELIFAGELRGRDQRNTIHLFKFLPCYLPKFVTRIKIKAVCRLCSFDEQLT